MKIIIDSTIDNEICLHALVNTNWIQRKYVKHPGGVVGSIRSLLLELGLEPAVISGLGVVLEKGRFTATRIAVTAINSMAFALGVSVVGLVDADHDRFIDALSRAVPGELVAARYSAAPSIGGKRT